MCVEDGFVDTRVIRASRLFEPIFGEVERPGRYLVRLALRQLQDYKKSRERLSERGCVMVELVNL